MARGIVCALAGGVCWGFSGTCAQLLMNDYGAPAEWITCVRMVLAAVFFLFLTAVRDWRDLVAVFRDRRSLVQIALFAVFGVLLTQMSYLNAIRYTSAGVGTTIEQIGLVLSMLYVCVRGGWRAPWAACCSLPRRARSTSWPSRPRGWDGGSCRPWRWPSTRSCPCAC